MNYVCSFVAGYQVLEGCWGGYCGVVYPRGTCTDCLEIVCHTRLFACVCAVCCFTRTVSATRLGCSVLCVALGWPCVPFAVLPCVGPSYSYTVLYCGQASRTLSPRSNEPHFPFSTVRSKTSARLLHITVLDDSNSENLKFVRR